MRTQRRTWENIYRIWCSSNQVIVAAPTAHHEHLPQNVVGRLHWYTLEVNLLHIWPKILCL